jgi:hypothetical protein
MGVIAIDHVQAPRCARGWKSVIYDYSPEAPVEIQTKNVFARLGHSWSSLIMVIWENYGSKKLGKAVKN